MSELVGVMLVESAFSVQAEAAVNYNANKRETLVYLAQADDGTIAWRAHVVALENPLISARCRYIPEFTVPDGQTPSTVSIDTAIAQAYDAFCLQYDIWRRASHIEWLPVLPMSLGMSLGSGVEHGGLPLHQHQKQQARKGKSPVRAGERKSKWQELE
ncbi:MAG: hypothetical protein IPP12_22205 [Nitrospira sp.]|nr:hypothetical protein [Nitrospira sp.]